MQGDQNNYAVWADGKFQLRTSILITSPFGSRGFPMLKIWQFKRGIRSGYRDSQRKEKRDLTEGSTFKEGYPVGMTAYALSISLEVALRDGVAAFESRTDRE